MTLPYERTNAVNWTREFLRDIANGTIKKIPKDVREQARSLLKHYPGEYDLRCVIEKNDREVFDTLEGFMEKLKSK